MNAGNQGRRILVTGGAGFIGSHLIERLIERGDHVTVIDNLTTGTLDNLAGLDRSQVTIITKSVSDCLGSFAPGSFDEIYHLAAAVGVRLVIEKPIHTIETNVHETSAVLDFAAATATPLLVASTSEVYGKSTKTPFSEDDDVVYGPTTLSRWSYACSKAIDEYLSLAYHAQRNLPVVIVRFFNTVGPRQIGTYGMVLPRFVRAALVNEPIEVYGDGTQSRCFCDVRDVVTCLPKLISTDTCFGRVFNLGSDRPISINDLAALVRDTLGSDSKITHTPYDRAFGAGFDDLQERRPDLTRVHQATGFEPRIELEQTIRDLAAQLSGHPIKPPQEVWR